MTDQFIAITGFMAAGKTTVGRALAARLDCEFVDLDELIAAQQGQTIKQIIEAEGEDHFRQVETKALDRVLRETDACVVALGGGTWMIGENRRLLQKEKARVVWLDAPFELCWQRIVAAAETRPLATSRDVAERLHSARRSIYELAELRLVVSENKSANECAREIASLLLRNSVS
ncbi:MAG: shikimate kinase [bacterium]